MSSKVSRARHRLEPLSLKDAVAGPGLSGLSDVLQAMVQPHPLGQYRAVLPFVSPGVTMTPGDIKSPGESGSPDDATPPGDVDAPGDRKPPGDSSQSLIPSGRVLSRNSQKRPSATQEKRQKGATELVTMQQGLNASEQTVYHCLYMVRDSEDCVRNLSMPTIGRRTGLSERTCQRVLRELAAKQIVEIQPPPYGTAEAPVYRVKSFAAVLQIWRELGFTQVRGGRTRILMDPFNSGRQLGGGFRLQPKEGTRSHEELHCSGDESNLSPGDTKSPGDLKSPPPGDIKSGGPGDMKSPLSIKGNKDRNKYRNTQATATSAVDVAAVAAALCQYAAGDRMAAERIVESAQGECPDCSTEDVVEAIRRKATHLQRQDGIKSPVGVLIASCGELVLAARNERVATEASQAEEEAGREHAQKEAAFLASLHGLPSNNHWRQILDHCKDRIPPQSFDTWLKPTHFAGIRDRALQVYVPSSEFKSVGEKYADHFAQAITGLGLDLVGIEFMTSDEFVRQGEESGDDR